MEKRLSVVLACLFLFVGMTFAQNKISGTVVSAEDGDPIMTGKDIDVHIEERGIRIIINPDDIEDHSLPNPILNAFSEFFNNINNVREDIEKQGKRIQTINKVLLRKLTRL